MEDQKLSTLVVSIMDSPYELSPNWKEHYEGRIFTREDLYKEEVISTLNYLKLRKIKRLMEMNQKDLEKSHTSEEQLTYIQTHLHLKNMEKQLMENVGTVIAHHQRRGLVPHPELNVTNASTLRLPYALPIAAGCLATFWTMATRG